MNWPDISNYNSLLGAIASAIVILASIYAGYVFSYKRGYKKAKEQLLDEHYKQQYEKIYAPLRAIFFNTQITSSKSTAFPYLRQRLKRSLRFAKDGKIKKSLKAITEKGVSGPSAEIEYGPGFPLDAIQTILTENASLANPEILNLYQWVDRAQYESNFARKRDYENELLQEEFELFVHIMEKYAELSKRFS